MFEFLKKKPAPAPVEKPVVPAAPAPREPAAPALQPSAEPSAPAARDPVAELAAALPPTTAAPVRSGWSPDELVAAFSDVQAEKAARLEAEKAAARVAVRETMGASLLARSLGGLFSGNPKLDEDLLDEVETALVSADVGIAATTDLVSRLRKRMKAREFADANALQAALRADLLAILAPIAKPLEVDASKQPFVILTVGVNGVGKTTTIGKLARRFQLDGHSLMLAAGDTFRAAAVEQLKIWGERNNVVVISQGQNADAASVAFDALQAAKSRNFDVLIADTAGRLHTQAGLMAELGKIRRVLTKLDPQAPHEVLMVIDGTTGQNALSQLRAFHAAVGVTGLVVTKLDGSAKGGVLFALAREFGIPIRYIGLGEKLDDLRVFDPDAFVDALLPERLGA
jgi:fused signal recognition particle receptor